MVEPHSTPESLRDAFVASLDWWREAGVEDFVEDAPSGWLRSEDAQPENERAVAAEASSPPPEQSAEPVRRGALSRFLADPADNSVTPHPGDPAAWPGDLEEFRTWWLESDAVDAPGAFPRVAPRGAAGAHAMLIVAQPQEHDTEQLLGGPAGKLATAMLRAMGFGEGETYIASVLPRHNLRPDWQGVAAAGYAQLLLHHIAVARPQRVIACGERVWSLLAHGAAQDPRSLTNIATGNDSTPAFAIPDMQTLLQTPAARAQTWNRWLDWNDSPR